MMTRRFTLAQQPGQSLHVGIWNELAVSCSSFLTVLQVRQSSLARSTPIHARVITLRKCIHIHSGRIGRLNDILSLCSRATFSVPYIRRHSLQVKSHHRYIHVGSLFAVCMLWMYCNSATLYSRDRGPGELRL